jgi:hypothetical protein
MLIEDVLAAQIRQAAELVFPAWIYHEGAETPHDLAPDYWWEMYFKRAGKWHAEFNGRLWYEVGAAGQPEMRGRGEIENLTRVRDLQPPKHLYRAAWQGFEDRWNWFESFDMAKLMADDRPDSMRIWTCDVDKLFGSVTVNRVEPQGYKGTWTEWIVKPKNVREISRWRDPFSNPKNLEAWKARGTHAVNASGIIGSWFRSTDSKVAPMDREGGDYWLLQFQAIGQFEAFSHWDAADKSTPAQLKVEPAEELPRPKMLYRGSTEALKDRWSWTSELETAEAFRHLFCPADGKIWVAEAETVYGIIHAEIDNPEAPFPMGSFTEWIIQPKLDTIREWATDAALTMPAVGGTPVLDRIEEARGKPQRLTRP